MEKNKKYYKKNYYKKNNNNNKYIPKENKKVTYDSLMKAEVIANDSMESNYDNTVILRCIAISVVIFAIIICSLILFRVI